MDVENRLKDELKREGESIQPPIYLKNRIHSAIRKEKLVPRKIKMIKRVIVSVFVASVLIPVGVFADKTVIPELVERIIGTPVEAEKNWHISPEGYKERMQEMQVAEKYLTEDELNDYVQLESERIKIYEKVKKNGVSTLEAMKRMSEEDQHKLDEIDRKISFYWSKILPHFTYTREEAQVIMGFPLRHPTYLPIGYTLEDEEIEPDITVNDPKPIVSTRYTDGEVDMTIEQSEVIKGNRDPFEFNFDKVESYQLQGKQFLYGKDEDSSLAGMKIIVPAHGERPDYQIVVFANETKEEIEKIILSLLEE